MGLQYLTACLTCQSVLKLRSAAPTLEINPCCWWARPPVSQLGYVPANAGFQELVSRLPSLWPSRLGRSQTQCKRGLSRPHHQLEEQLTSFVMATEFGRRLICRITIKARYIWRSDRSSREFQKFFKSFFGLSLPANDSQPANV